MHDLSFYSLKLIYFSNFKLTLYFVIFYIYHNKIKMCWALSWVSFDFDLQHYMTPRIKSYAIQLLNFVSIQIKCDHLLSNCYISLFVADTLFICMIHAFNNQHHGLWSYCYDLESNTAYYWHVIKLLTLENKHIFTNLWY